MQLKTSNFIYTNFHQFKLQNAEYIWEYLGSWNSLKSFSMKRIKKRWRSLPLSFFLWSYCVLDDWLSSRAAVSPVPWWFCIPERIRTQFCRTRSVSCPALCAAVYRATRWIYGNDLWYVCARCLRRLSFRRNRQENLTFCGTKTKQHMLYKYVYLLFLFSK